MLSFTRTTAKLLVTLGIAAGASASIGCAAPTLPEREGSKAEKLLAPKALTTTYASAYTQDELGITQWRLYRGKNNYFLTGYDDRGQPVKGVAMGFAGGSNAPSLYTRALDGSSFGLRHDFGGQDASTGDASNETKLLLAAATFDLAAARVAMVETAFPQQFSPRQDYFGENFPQPGGTLPGGQLPYPGAPGGIDPNAGQPNACKMDMITVAMASLQCMLGGVFGGTATTDKGACIQAALASAAATGNCTGGIPIPIPMPVPGTSTTPIDPNTGTPIDPNTGAPIDPNAGGTTTPIPVPSSPFGGLGGIFAGILGNLLGGDPFGGLGYPQQPQPFAGTNGNQGFTCASCPSDADYDDLDADPDTGEVKGGQGFTF